MTCIWIWIWIWILTEPSEYKRKQEHHYGCCCYCSADHIISEQSSVWYTDVFGLRTNNRKYPL